MSPETRPWGGVVHGVVVLCKEDAQQGLWGLSSGSSSIICGFSKKLEPRFPHLEMQTITPLPQGFGRVQGADSGEGPGVMPGTQ